MTDSEKLIVKIEHDSNVKIEHCDLSKYDLNGICFSDNNEDTIFLHNKLSEQEAVYTIAHEYGHVKTGLTGHTERDEYRADKFATNLLISVETLIKALKQGVSNNHQLAEYLNVSEQYIPRMLEFLKAQYGTYVEHKQYVLHFQPLLCYDRGNECFYPQ